MKRSNSLFLGLVASLVAIGGCNAQTLEGGSDDPTTKTPETKSPEGTGGGGGASAISDTPIAGSIGGRTFEAKSIDVYFSKKDEQWFFSIRNYETDCGSRKTPPDPTTSMVVSVGAIDPKAGELPLAYGDRHGATFQIGVYTTTDKADTRSIENGTLRFDVWDETPGAKITGAIKATAGDSIIEGTFVAKMCAPR